MTQETQVTDKRKNKSEGLGTAAAVQTSTLKPRDMGAGLAAFFREGDVLKIHPGEPAVAALAEKGLEIVKQTGSGWIVAKVGAAPPETSTEGRATGTVLDPDRFCPACGDALFVHGDLLKCSAGLHTLGPDLETRERAIGFWAAARMQHAAGRSVEEAAARLWCDADDRMSAKWAAWTEEKLQLEVAREGSRSDPGGSSSDPPSVPEPPPSPLAPTEPPPVPEASAAPATPPKRPRGRPRKNPPLPAEAQDRAMETGPPAPPPAAAPMPVLEGAEGGPDAGNSPSAEEVEARIRGAIRALEPKRPYTPPAVESSEPLERATTRETVYEVEPLGEIELVRLGELFVLSLAFGVTVEEADRRVREATLALQRTVLRPYPGA